MFVRGFSIVACVVTLSMPALADAPRLYGEHGAPPRCTGSDKASADKELATGVGQYRRAKAQTPADQAELAAALASFEAACASGNDAALEYRAYALAGLQRWVEAAETLDAFIAAHPLDSFDPNVRERVTSQRGEILERVASLTVESKPRAVRVMINHHDMGMTPIGNVRLAPGTYDIEAASEDGAPIRRTVALAAGPHTETFDSSPVTHVEVAPLPERPAGFWTSQRVVGAVVAVTGAAVGLGVGLGFVFGGSAINAQIPNDCPSGGSDGVCSIPSEQSKRESDRNQVATDWVIGGVALGVGAAAAVAGLVIFAVAPSSSKKTGAIRFVPWIAPGTSGLVLTEVF